MRAETVVAEIVPPEDEKYPNRWKKGQSGNPAGRPKLGDAMAELAREALEEVHPAERDLAEREHREPRTNKRAIIDKLIAQALVGDKKAITTLWTRAYGQPSKHVQVEHGGTVEHRAGRQMIEEQIDTLAGRKLVNG